MTRPDQTWKLRIIYVISFVSFYCRVIIYIAFSYNLYRYRSIVIEIYVPSRSIQNFTMLINDIYRKKCPI